MYGYERLYEFFSKEMVLRIPVKRHAHLFTQHLHVDFRPPER